MNKTIIITNEQLKIFFEFAKKDGKVLVKHLPGSSDFHSKDGSWKNTWINIKGEKKWPSGHSSDEMVGCHVVDIKTRDVYIYPKSKCENTSIIGKEDEFIFIADKELLVPFNLSDTTYNELKESPKERLNKALSKISFF